MGLFCGARERIDLTSSHCARELLHLRRKRGESVLVQRRAYAGDLAHDRLDTWIVSRHVENMTTAKTGSPQTDPGGVDGRFGDQVVERIVMSRFWSSGSTISLMGFPRTIIKPSASAGGCFSGVTIRASLSNHPR